MAIGSKDKGNAFDVLAASDIVSGDPVIVGDILGVAQTSADNTTKGNPDPTKYYATVRTNGEWYLPVAGTLAVGELVYKNTGTAVAGQAVKITLTATEGTGAKPVLGYITGVAQAAGYALVSIAGTVGSKGAA